MENIRLMIVNPRLFAVRVVLFVVMASVVAQLAFRGSEMLGNLESAIDDVAGTVSDHEGRIDEVRSDVDDHDDKIDQLESEVNDLQWRSQ